MDTLGSSIFTKSELEAVKKDPAKVSILMKQFKTFHKTLAYLSDARRNTHTIFVAITTLIFLLIGVSGGNGEAIISTDKNLLYFANLSGVLMSMIWYSIIFRYRRRSKIILLILREVEKVFPLQLLEKEHKLWKNFPKSIRFILTESWIPFVFAFVHVAISLGVYFGFFRLGVV